MIRRLTSSVILTTLVLQAGLAAPLRAQDVETDPGFDPNVILADEDIFDANGMSYARLVNFLKSKGTLADYRTPDIDGVPKTAAEIIWRVSQSYKINPKYLLALIQKEQSLVEDPNPSQKQFDWAAGFAICDACSKDDPSLQEFKGFASQLEWAAKQHREKYLLQLLSNGQTRAGKAPGKTITIDGMDVTPVNNATAMLYSYTPHIHGNLNLWRIWRRWFSLRYPDGTVVRSKSSGKTYLLRHGEKRPFASRAVMETLADPAKIVELSETDLAAYPDGTEIRFPKYALLRDPNGRIWLLTGKEKRHIADMAAFRKFGFNEDEVQQVEDADLEGYPEGPKINVKTEFPQGVVFQDAATKAYWYVEDGVRHELPHKTFLALYFRGRNIRAVTTKKLEAYALGDPYRFHEGELVRGTSKSSVYVVEEDRLRPIPSAEVFESLGWKWKNVIAVSDDVLNDYDLGEPVILESMGTPQATLTLL